MNVLPIALLFFLASLNSAAKTLSEKALFNRCYIHLSGRPVPRNHALMQQVIQGQITGVNACNTLLDSVILDDSTGLLTNSNAETLAILNNLYAFHRNWFSTTIIEQIQDYGDENSPRTRNLYDSTEPSLAVTRALFAQTGKYDDIVRAPNGVNAIREDDPKIRIWNVHTPNRNDPNNIINFREFSGDFDRNSNTTKSTMVNMDSIQTGELKGIAWNTKSFTTPNVSLNLLGQAPNVRGNDEPGLNYAFDFYKSHGAGVIGSPIYLMLNFGHGVGLKMNGSTKVPRRWVKALMENFMCAALPTLRESDITQHYVGNSSAPFRNSISCLRCHATMDQMAYTARNMIMTNSDVYPTNEGNDPVKVNAKTSMMITSYKNESASVSGWPSEPVTDFHRQSPNGRVYTRLFSGKLLNKNVNNISEVGSALAETDDYYQCAAKRYFEYFTGINVALYDRTDPSNAAINKLLTPINISDRKFIETLATELKEDPEKSVKRLLKRIFSSAYYRNSNFRP